MIKPLHNLKCLEDRRRSLRNHATPAEAGLWSLIKNKKLGRKFRRQHSVGYYILDFYCPEERLAIELDGKIHDSEEVRQYDQKRTEYLNRIGINVIRFKNKLVFEEPEEVVREIRRCFRSFTT